MIKMHPFVRVETVTIPGNAIDTTPEMSLKVSRNEKEVKRILQSTECPLHPDVIPCASLSYLNNSLLKIELTGICCEDHYNHRLKLQLLEINPETISVEYSVYPEG